MAIRLFDEFEDAGGEAGRFDRNMTRRALKTLAIAIHRRLRDARVDQVTQGEWLAQINAEWNTRKADGD